MATIPLPRVITPQVDIETLAGYVGGRVHTVQDLLSEHSKIADKVLRYGTGEPLNQRGVEAAIGEAERYMNGMHAQNYLSRRSFFGTFAPFLQVEDASSETEAKQAASLIAEQNYGTSPSTRRDFMGRVALLLTALAAGVSQQACGLAAMEGNKLGKDMSLEERLHQYLRYVDSAVKAGTWDPVYGPSLAFWRGIPQDFEGHKEKVRQIGEYIGRTTEQAGSVDYDVPIGTPVVATHPFYCYSTGDERLGGLVVHATYTMRYTGSYAHLSEILVTQGQGATRGTIIGLSGTTGTSYPHLDLALFDRWEKKLVNPFEKGENGGKPRVLTDKYIDKSYVGIRHVFDKFVELYTGPDKQAFASKMLEQLIKTKDSNNLVMFVSENPSLFQRDAWTVLPKKRRQWTSQELRASTLPFPSPEILRKDLSSDRERYYHLPNAIK